LAKFNAKISAKMSVVKDAILPALATLVDATKIGSFRVASIRVVRGKYAWPIEIGLEHAPFVVLIFFSSFKYAKKPADYGSEQH
jgi:hypothetical protein